MILPEEEQIVPKPPEEIAQKKNTSQKKLKNKNLWPRNEFSIKWMQNKFKEIKQVPREGGLFTIC